MLRVKRSDGAASKVEILIPNEVDMDLEDDGTHLLRLDVRGEGIRVLGADVTYGVRYYKAEFSPGEFCRSPYFKFYELPLENAIEEIPGGAAIIIDMDEHEKELRYSFAKDFELTYDVAAHSVLGLTHMKMEVIIGDDSWAPPGGGFDRDVLSSPIALANVSNGFGFVVGGYNQDMALWPSKATVLDTRFFDYLMRPPGVCVDFCGCGLYAD